MSKTLLCVRNVLDVIKYSLRYILWTHDKNTDGKYPVYLRITINRERKYIATGVFLTARAWDKKTELVVGRADSAEINADLSARRQRILKYIAERQLENKAITAASVKEAFSSAKDQSDFFQFAEQFISDVSEKRSPGMVKNYNKLVRKLEVFNGSRVLSFEQINYDFLVKLETDLRKRYAENYIHALWRVLKTFFNAARKRGVTTHYPFDGYDNPKYTSPEKDYLTIEEIKKIEKFADKASTPALKQSAVYFLFGCYSGLRVSDWYRFDINKHVRNGELLLRAKKNKEWVSMPVHSKLKENFSRMRDLPLKITDVEINRSLKDIAKEIKCSKRISCHTSRHSFAISMCLNRGLSSEVSAELMGITLSTFVDNYSQITRKKIFAEASRAWKSL